MCQCFTMLAVHGHGRGKRLVTCLVLQPHAFCVMSLQHVPIFHYAGCEHLNMLVVHGHGQGTPRYVPSVCRICCGHNCVCD